MLNSVDSYRKGYFMTLDDEKAAKAAALLDYTEAKQRYALLKNQVEKIAQSLEAGVKMLRDRPEIISFSGADAAVLKSYMGMESLVDDLKKTRADLQRLASLLSQVGLGYVIME